MTFGKWPEEIHYEPEQLRRIERARAISKDDVSVNITDSTGVFLGPKKPHSKERNEYYCTVDSCTCMDFIINNKRERPCKHMYRLATECNLLPDDGSSLSEEIGFIENYTNAEQKLLMMILSINVQHDVSEVWVEFSNDNSTILEVSPHIPEFVSVPSSCIIDNPFIQFIPLRLRDCTDRHIYSFLDKVGQRPTHELTGDDLVKWVENMVSKREIELYLQKKYIAVIPFYRNTMKKAYRYLVRKFNWTDYYFNCDNRLHHVRFPSDAQFDKSVMALFGDGVNPGEGNSFTCLFPDDEITELLTLYGHNRCVGGFNAIVE